MDINYVPHDMSINEDVDFGEDILWVAGNLTINGNVKAKMIVANRSLFISHNNDAKPISIVSRHIQSFENISISHAVDLQKVDTVVAEGEIFLDNPIHYPKKCMPSALSSSLINNSSVRVRKILQMT